MWNKTLYGITTWSVVYALDARTGERIWRWDPEINQAAVRPKICCGIVNRGVAMYDNLIISAVLDGRLIALDMATGKPVWEARHVWSQDSYTITMAPRIAKGKVIIGAGGAEYPVRGVVAAFDAKTGKEAWRFYTIPGDPAKGYENDDLRKAAATWAPDSWKLGGGGTVWDGMAYDPDEELVYVGTGNAGPWPEDLRMTHGKDALYACSILAINVNTGKLKWYFQNVPGDSWDYDTVAQLMLADLNIKGKTRKVIMQANKNGFYYVIDRVTGEFISGKPYAKVTWAAGLDEKTGRPIVHPSAVYTADESIQLTPGPGGAHNWPPMSFNPSTGFVYIPGQSGAGFNYQVDPQFNYKPGELNLGIAIGGGGGGNQGKQGKQAPGAPNAESPEVAAARAAAAATFHRTGHHRQLPLRLGSRESGREVAQAWRRQRTGGNALHRRQPRLPNASRWPVDGLQRRQGRRAPRTPHGPAERHRSADDVHARRQAIHRRTRWTRPRPAAGFRWRRPGEPQGSASPVPEIDGVRR
jgi:PQQ-dependent dehydrogenase (methanol/ethanol family)